MPMKSERIVPPLDLAREYRLIASEVRERVERVLASGNYVLSREVREFEERFAAWNDVPYGVGVSSGSEALYLVLKAFGIGPGDEVITVSWTFVATVAAILRTGARPVLVDVEKDTYVMDAAQAERAITPRTRAILAVHLYGQPCDMDALSRMAKPRHLRLIEDCAQAHGAEWNGRKAGSWGDAGCFSFYPTKNLGAAGDGGAIVVREAALAERLKQLRQHGAGRKYFYTEEFGVNARLDELQAAILNAKLKYLDDWNSLRRKAAAFYAAELAPLQEAVRLPWERPGAKHVYHLYTIGTAARDRLESFLKDHGILASINYPLPVHQQDAYKKLGLPQRPLPETDGIAREVLSLPLFPLIERDEQAYVVEKMKAFFKL